jgi:alcohol dehydrogenase
LPKVLRNPGDLDARGRMLLGAAFAGTAIENSMLGAAHAAANPLTATFDIVHGEAVGIMLPHVVRFNASDSVAKQAYAELASAPEIACVSDGLDAAIEALVRRLEALLNAAQIARSLSQLRVKSEQIKLMAEAASQQWTATFNPRAIEVGHFEQLYADAMEKRGDGDGLVG